MPKKKDNVLRKRQLIKQLKSRRQRTPSKAQKDEELAHSNAELKAAQEAAARA